jgi:hypothetical protein
MEILTPFQQKLLKTIGDSSLADNFYLTYLPQLRQELLQVLAKYENLDLDQVTVNVESQGGCEVLELNVILSDPSNVRKIGGAARHAPFFSEVKPERSVAPAR